MTRLIQVKHRVYGRRVGAVNGQKCQLVARFRSAYALAQRALSSHASLDAVLSASLSDDWLDYNAIY
ncbi:MAG: GguC protein, partial [bacterium]|nr:GguC protein [bacterium]